MHRDWTQEDLAKKIGASKIYISLMESDKKEASIDLLKSVAKALEIPAILLLWKKIGLPSGVTSQEKKIREELVQLLEEAQKRFANRILGQH